MHIQDGGNDKVIVSHKGASSAWEISAFEKTSFSHDFDDFEQINGYWAFLPESSQDAIFKIYEDMREIFNEIFDTQLLFTELREQLALLDRYHTQEDVHHWATFHGNLRVPESVKSVPPPDLPRERTYLVPDYLGLVTLAISMRPLIPVWGEYITRTKKVHGNNFKEFYAARLLQDTSMVLSPAFLRLDEFVRASIPTDKSIDSAIYDSIGSKNFPEWVRSMIVVRKLCVGDVRGIDPFANLPAVIFKYLNNKVKGMDSNFAGIVKDKPKAEDWSDSEQNISTLEMYKVKEAVAAGDIAIQSWYTEDVLRMTRVVAPSIETKILDQSRTAVMRLENEQIHECQTVLMQWVMAPALSPRGLLRLNKESILRVLAATQAILWHWGYYEIAALSTAIAMREETDHYAGGGDKISRLTQDQIETLNKLFPFQRRQGGKRSKTPRQSNPAIVALENVNELFSEHVWRLTVPKEWLQRLTEGNSRMYMVPTDFRRTLANLIITIANDTTT
jgi:hypothetical protein